jgi:hypothetical protein
MCMITRLVTIVIGDAYQRDFARYGRDRFFAYAKRHGYVPEIISAPIRELPGKALTWQKLCLPSLPWFNRGDRVVCIDSDVLITADAPAFPAVPDGTVGGVLDKGPYQLNSGVMTYRASSEIADIFAEALTDTDPYWDQKALTNVLRGREKFVPVDERFHCMFYLRSLTLARSLLRRHWFYHALSSKRKLVLIERLLAAQGR